MNMLRVHAEAMEEAGAAYHEFLLAYRNDAELVFGFFEGSDDISFYRGAIESALPERWVLKSIVAGSKKKVLRSFLDFDWVRFQRRRVCFFVDRDLSDLLGTEIPRATNIYVTDGYSIENFLVQFSSFERTLDEILGVNGLSATEQDRLRSMFDAAIDTFVAAMIPVMAQILLWMQRGDNPCLDNVRIDRLFLLSNGECRPISHAQSDEARVSQVSLDCGLPCASTAEIAEAGRRLRDLGCDRYLVRGRYLLWFFVRLLIHTRDNVHAILGRSHGRPPSARVSLGPANAVAVIGPRVRPPDSLKRFVEENYLAYVQGHLD